MLYSLPKLDKDAIPLSHFPTPHQAFIFRAYEYVPPEKIAKILATSVENVIKAAKDMGLPDYAPGDIWLRRGYITIIRRLWHVLPYEQLLSLLEMSADELALIMREEDFLDIKLGGKPICQKLTWRELTAEEAKKTEKIKSVMQNLDFSGKPPFSFEYNLPKIKFEGNERFSTRMIYAFSGLYQRAFDVDSEEFLPDEQLRAYSELGINGIWTQGVLSQLAEFPFEPTVSAGYEKRIERMAHLVKRLKKYGMKLYLYINEPRAMPIEFFNSNPDIKGHTVNEKACLCTSTERVKSYLRDAIESLCRAVPDIGGFFTITRSENVTNCFSHSEETDCGCPRCKKLGVAEVISQTVSCILEGARRVSPDIKVFAWNWRWDEHNEQIIKKLPKGVILISQSELNIPFEIGGVQGNVLDYSMSIVGPGDFAREQWKLARECGLEIGAKVQINTTWEVSTVPAVPVSPTIEEHVSALADEGVEHLLLSWTLGGYPCRNIAAAAKYFYDRCTMPDEDERIRAAEEQFAKAFREFPFHIRVLYLGPQNAGPSTMLSDKPTGYESTMTCFAYDDLESWRAIYPTDVFESQFQKLCDGWREGLEILPENDTSEATVMAHATYCLFKSSLNQIKFIRARNDGRFTDAANAARDELEIARLMFALMGKNAAIGYEAANHYYFSRGQLAEKIVNCEHIISEFANKS